MSNVRTRKKFKTEHPTKTAEVKRKRDDSITVSNGTAGKSAGASTSHSSGSGTTLNTLAWIVSLSAFAVFAYMKPSLIKELIDSWVGFSEHFDSGVTPTEHLSRLPADIARRDAVVSAFKHAWYAYERDAMGDDEYHPVSQQGSNLTKAGGMGYMVVDALDTMYLMGLTAEYSRSRGWVAAYLSFDRDAEFSTFETTIRVLGGLLSAYHLSGEDTLYLEKAAELADKMLPAFDSSSGLPFPIINLEERKGYHTRDYPSLVSVAEIGTLQLEFRYLSYLTENEEYWRKVEKIMQVIKAARLPHGLASCFLNQEEGRYITSAISLGSRGDSFYEYLLKQYLQTGRSEKVYRDMYEDAMVGAHNYLIRQSATNKMTYTSELRPEEGEGGEISWRLTPKQDHLVCFLGGSLLLGATQTGALVDRVSRPPQAEELSPTGLRDWKTGIELIKTCMQTHDTATGLSPEVVYFRVPSDGMDDYALAPSDWYIRGAQPGVAPPYDARYMLRPETVESLFIAYRLTGDDIYRDYGWNIFQAIEKHCRVDSGGYATILNVDANPAQHEDKMETFFLGETLKYLYLLFSDSDVLPLDKYVFNTEAHPLPIFTPNIKTGFS